MASVAVFLNIRASGGDRAGVTAELREALAARHLAARIVAPTAGVDLVTSVRDNLDGAAIAVAAGGDGTVNAVATVIAGTPTPLGVIPLGTLNHFAKDLGLPLDLDQAVGVIAAGRTANVDVGDVNGRVFVNNSSIGVYPSLVHAREALQQRGHRKWPAFVLAAIGVLRTQHRLLVRVEAARQAAVWRTPFVMVGNNAYDVTGFRTAGRTRLDGGKVFAYVAPPVRVRELPATLIRAWLGRVLHQRPGSDGFQVVSATELWIDARGPRAIRAALDGEVATLALPLHYRSRPGRLVVLVPAK